jgi:RNA polymerase sigma-70 factor, ECF subfamily
MHESELPLIKRWQQGDEQATHALFNQYYPRMVRLAVLNGLTQDEAQDCAQEAFLRAFERRKQLRDPQAFPLWFQRLFTHYLLDVLKARNSHRQLPLEAVDEEEASLLTAHPEEIAITAEGQAQLWQRVQALPATYRIALTLRYYEDYSLREIAHLLGKREATIRVIVHRALQRLRLDTEERFSAIGAQGALLVKQSPTGAAEH